MVVCLTGCRVIFVTRSFRGKEIVSGDSDERDESERASVLSSVVTVL